MKYKALLLTLPRVFVRGVLHSLKATHSLALPCPTQHSPWLPCWTALWAWGCNLCCELFGFIGNVCLEGIQEVHARAPIPDHASWICDRVCDL
jgi:hypothetical protein